jgi:hypothetical protein
MPPYHYEAQASSMSIALQWEFARVSNRPLVLMVIRERKL